MDYKLYDNGQIMKVKSEGHEVATPYMHKVVEINGVTISVSEPKEIPVTFIVFDLDAGGYITDTQVNKTVDVYVNGEVLTTEPIVNGEGVIQFESAEAGTFEIMVDNYKCEVIVNG